MGIHCIKEPQSDEDNWTAPFTTDDYDATTRRRCRATNREVKAKLDGDTWVLHFENGEVWEVPRAAIEGG